MQLETVGEIVRVLRSRLDLEQVELARACGWRDASAVSRIETDRIRPTRRTLIKLAESLSRDGTTGSSREVQAWLFLASGILPTADDVRAVDAELPAIESWGQPALIMDFGWHVWRANPLVARLLGLQPAHVGRNYLELLFEPGGPLRTTLGHRWERAATTTLTDFRHDNDSRAGQRWHRKLLARLGELPDFKRLYETAVQTERRPIPNRLRAQLEEGTVAMLRFTVTADPRLLLTHIVPEDARMTREMMQRGVLLA